MAFFTPLPCLPPAPAMPVYTVAPEEVTLEAIRAQGAGGQNVNKVSSAIHLRFDIRASSLPDWLKERLLRLGDQRLTRDGILVIKAQEFRTQEQNRAAALERLNALVAEAAHTDKPRRPTRPSRAALGRRKESKQRHGEIKRGRGKVAW
ncbi:alternative ribosome rescue aminoacyl-tRNA hydrolase ArfB [Azospira inquinata]